MSKIGSVIAVGGVSTVLGALVYFGVATAKGADLHQIPPLSWFGHDMPHPDPAMHAPAPVASAPAPRVESPVVPPMTAGVLGAFVLPSPFDSRELQDLQKKLTDRLEKVAATEKELARRAAELDDWQKTLEERTRELDEVRLRIEKGPSAAAPDKTAGAVPDAEKDQASWRAMSPLFAEGDVDDLAAKLASFTPEEAAQVLKGLEPERAAALLNALPKAQYKPFLDAWRLAKD